MYFLNISRFIQKPALTYNVYRKLVTHTLSWRIQTHLTMSETK